MHRFMVDPGDIRGNTINIVGDDLKHLRQVLRLGEGDIVQLFDGSGMEYEAQLTFVGKMEAHATILESRLSESEPALRLTLYQGLAKAEKMDLIIQKAVELGIYRIVPVMTERTVVQLDDSDRKKKSERWNRIAKEASKQCRRAFVPQVAQPLTLEMALKEIGQDNKAVLLYENEQKKCLKELMKCYTINKIGVIALFIGPEGGFSKEEVERIIRLGVEVASLGKRILRTETAAISAISIIMYEMGEMQL